MSALPGEAAIMSTLWNYHIFTSWLPIASNYTPDEGFRPAFFHGRGQPLGSTAGFELEQVRQYIREQEEADRTSGQV